MMLNQLIFVRSFYKTPIPPMQNPRFGKVMILKLFSSAFPLSSALLYFPSSKTEQIVQYLCFNIVILRLYHV